ncbi:Pleiotropic drug resistance protein 3 [Platanthera guangdongensis]|uniref:Pleiotropic drug resistance protein 3 n=1 Tax=Platanthera guangdongensis TaxID=2320717 RepID=A0ABR2M301_9ASPA
MEPGESITGVLRLGSSKIWGGDEIFSVSTSEEDDLEALKWAALEKLPTYTRLHKGLLPMAEGPEEVDIENLGPEQRRQLLQRLVRVAEEDHERLLLKLKGRIDSIEVRYQNLKVEAKAYAGNRGLPTLFNFFLNALEGFANYLHILPSRKKPLIILNNLSGIIKPRRMTLLLGPPGSGRTTLLLALAGKLGSDIKVINRKITYNGHEMSEFVPQRTAVYISQHDLHLGEMTVRETLEFSARCQGIGARYGLEVCADTMVGDNMRRGISGGQKKRVTTGEMIVGPAKALFMDEISTGLDSSTTFQIVNSLKHSVHILDGTAVITLLQPPPETFALFDDIILLSDGQVVYQGPREHVLEFFEYMGFKCPERKGVADFLQEVTSRKDQQQYWARQEEPYRFVNVSEFSDAFHSFHIGKKLENELSVSFDKRKSHPAALTTSKYGVRRMELLKHSQQLMIMAFIVMTLFLRTNMHRDSVVSGGIYMGALFFSIIMIMFNGFSDLSLTIMKLPVFYKQRDYLFYPAWVYALPSWILKIPISFIEVGVWVFSTYYVIGFDPNVGRFFKVYLLLLFVNQMSSALFRFIAALGREMVVANTFGAFSLLILMVMGGFILSHDNIKKWWIWGYWISPMMYAQNAITTNEFLGKSWKHILPGSSESLGVSVLKSRGIFPEAKWYWIGLGALAGYVILFNFFFAVALTYLKPFGKAQPTISEDTQKEKQANITGETEQSLAEANKFEINSKNKESVGIDVVVEVNEKKKGMVLPFAPLCITFNDIRYSVDMPQEMKEKGIQEDRLELLKGVSGSFRPGVLTALMGVSGAGKTTLMDVLAGRKTGGYIDGSILVNGYPKKQETFARISGYCEQNDIHSPHLTVYESLVYSAWLRLPTEVNPGTRKMFIEEVMELVELTPLREALVGLPGINGLSTEQRKRLTISVELVANPSIIFMDEPTSGLDARAAAIVMRTVRNTVDTGRTVVCTIHQPSIDIFEAFDELFLMKRGGSEIYVGPLGLHSSHLISYFEGIEGVDKIKNGYNPATWMLEVTTIAREEIMGIDFNEIYKSSGLFKRNKDLIQGAEHPAAQFTRPLLPHTVLTVSHYSVFGLPLETKAFILAESSIYCSEVYVHFDYSPVVWKKQQDLFNAMGSMYSSVLFLGVSNSSTVQPVVAIERTVFYRERAAGMYSAMPYAFGQVVVEIPYIMVQAIIYGILVYSMIGFEWTAAKFFWYLFFMFFTFLYYTYYGMMAVGLTPSYNISSIVSAAFYGIWNLFSGFLIPRPGLRLAEKAWEGRRNEESHVAIAIIVDLFYLPSGSLAPGSV